MPESQSSYHLVTAVEEAIGKYQRELTERKQTLSELQSMVERVRSIEENIQRLHQRFFSALFEKIRMREMCEHVEFVRALEKEIELLESEGKETGKKPNGTSV